MLKKTVSLFLSLCFILPFGVYGAEAVYINSVEDLKNLSLRVAEGDNMKGVAVYLNNDLSLKGTFVPIGSFNAPFCGSFYGEGHTVSGLTVEREDSCNGLFGCIVGGGVYDLTVKGARIKGGDYCGVIVGRLFGYEGKATVSGCFAEGTVEGNSYVGGVAGFVYSSAQGVYAESTIKNSIFKGDVKGDVFVGGVCGKAEAISTISRAESRIENCKSYGKAEATGLYGTMCGGILGALDAKSNGGSAVALVKECVSYANTGAKKAAAGGISGVAGAEGYGASATIDSSVAFGNVKAAAIAGGLCGALEQTDRGVTCLKNSVTAVSLTGSDLYVIAKGTGAENCTAAEENTVYPTETELPAYKKGDANGDGACDNVDAAMILKADAGNAVFGMFSKKAADVNADGEWDNLDAVKILKYDAGLTEEIIKNG